MRREKYFTGFYDRIAGEEQSQSVKIAENAEQSHKSPVAIKWRERERESSEEMRRKSSQRIRGNENEYRHEISMRCIICAAVRE